MLFFTTEVKNYLYYRTQKERNDYSLCISKKRGCQRVTEDVVVANKVLGKELEGFSKWMDKPINTIADAEALVDQQKNMLFLSYQNGRSLLFYYLYGTVNFANAMLIKLLYSSKENAGAPSPADCFCSDARSSTQCYRAEFNPRGRSTRRDKRAGQRTRHRLERSTKE